MTGFDLGRFVAAQGPAMEAVRRELRCGAKRTHWMWFIFPQLAGLGHSPKARYYAIASLAEAVAYLAHPLLGPRLADCTALACAAPGTAMQIFGTTDGLKFHSSMTLFARTAAAPAIFGAALQRFFEGGEDRRTVDLLVQMAAGGTSGATRD